jgi:hypothetical protein
MRNGPARVPAALLLAAASLLPGCAERDSDLGIYGWNATEVRPYRADAAESPERLPIAAVTPADRPFAPPPRGLILFGEEGPHLAAACRELGEGLPREAPAGQGTSAQGTSAREIFGQGEGGWAPVATLWPDARAADELTPLDAQDCAGLARYYDLDRARAALAALGLPRRAGPVLAADPGAPGEVMVLDLTGLPEEDVRRGVAAWRDRITREPGFWGGPAVELAREELSDLVDRHGPGLVSSRRREG